MRVFTLAFLAAVAAAAFIAAPGAASAYGWRHYGHSPPMAEPSPGHRAERFPYWYYGRPRDPSPPAFLDPHLRNHAPPFRRHYGRDDHHHGRHGRSPDAVFHFRF